jgi:N-acetylglucosaminyldiphosphoundecaprenol N-acetyl-beta-D-mannosaminyltransferase
LNIPWQNHRGKVVCDNDFEKKSFLGLPLAALTTQGYLQTLLQAARARTRPFVVGYLNAATVNMAFASADYARRLSRMDCLYADGQAVVWAARWLGVPIPERVNAGDFTAELMRALAAEGLKLALVGGRPAQGATPSEAERAAAIFRSWAPGLQLVYTHHGFFTAAEAPALAAALEAADPDLVLLGMGSPRQERWAQEWAAAGKPRAWWCVGALFEYYAGTRRRAPVWLRRAGLEWLFRLALEPARLWRRYIIGNPLFVFRVLRGKSAPGADGD